MFSNKMSAEKSSHFTVHIDQKILPKLNERMEHMTLNKPHGPLLIPNALFNQ